MIAILLVSLLVSFGGDTLELRDGRLLKGKYVGGSQSSVRFEVNGQVEVIPVSEVLALTFGNENRSGSSSGAAPAQTAPAATNVNVPAGTPVTIHMLESVDSRQHKTGHRFTAELEMPLEVNGVLVAPAGTKVYGQLAEAKKGGRLARQAELTLVLTDLLIEGRRQPISTSAMKAVGERQGTVKKAAGGAAIGGLISGSSGAKTGAKVGVGASIITSKQVTVPQGTLLEFQLAQGFTASGVSATQWSQAGQPQAQPAAQQAQPAASAQSAPTGPVTLAVGTGVLIRMLDSVDSKQHKAGHKFTAVLEVPLQMGSQIVAPAGSQVYGVLIESKSGGRIVRKAELSLALTDLMLNGRRFPMVTGAYSQKGESQGTGKKVVGGAAIGGLIKGSSGAKTGAKVGAGVSIVTRGKQVSVPKGTLLEFQLAQPLTIQ